MMKKLGYALLAAGALASLVATAIGLGWVGRFNQRYANVYNTESAAMAYDSSRQYRQGINRDIARYCRDYAAADGVAKQAVATLILDTVSTFEGELTAANAACIEGIGQ